VFEGDNYIMNGDIVQGYLNLQCTRKDYEGAIKTKTKFIEYLKKEGTLDHQIRRSYLEILCLQILQEDFFRLEETMD